MEKEFNRVLALVNKNYTISKALIKLGIDRTTFYRKISKEQKRELKEAKTLNSTVYKYKSKFWGREVEGFDTNLLNWED